MQEIEVTAVIKTTDGKTETKKFTDEINAAYSRKKIRQFVRSDLYQNTKKIKTVVSLNIREEAEIYGNN